jgi:Icc protein
MPTILQLTDLHLMSDPAGELKGVRVRDITQRVIDDVRHRIDSGHCDVDRIVITGDLAHDELRETYFVLRELLGDLFPRCLLLPGNHDSRPFMREVFPELFAPDDDFLTFSVAVGKWRLIGLDTHVPGEVPGELGGPQLDWLVRELSEHSEQPTVLFLHHPPFSVGSAWVDAIGLKDAEQLMQRVAAAPQVKSICAGHVHQGFESDAKGVWLLTTPSASLQFRPCADDFELDTNPPGFRILRLDERFESEIVRLQD